MNRIKNARLLVIIIYLAPILAVAAGSNQSNTRAMPPSFGPDTQVFETPKYQRSLIDKCLYSRGDRQCGKPAADRFCQLKGYRESITYDLIERAGSTYLLGSETSCKGASCDAFRAVACRYKTASGGEKPKSKLYKTPKYRGSPVSECFRKDRECGSHAANEFCRINDFGYATSYRVEGSQQRTWLLGDKQFCTGNNCKALRYIQCENGSDGGQSGGLFPEPSYKGKRIARCVTQGKKCDQKAADEFCRLEGYRSASAYERWRNAGPTIRLGNSKICNKRSCDSLKNIQCSYDPPVNGSGNRNEKKFDNPTYQGYPVSRCIYRGNTCDQEAVDEFCRMNGYREAIAWEPAENIGPTIRLGNKQLCDKKSCDGFRNVVCKR